ncbi:MAG: helix-turn-helix transcriptional regulator [Oscillospiraceae bacterium]|nr:helix-turn-helix transcriptional regulator [Oscillospiraceae bacterium]
MNLRIRQLRESRGLTQSAVADKLICDQSLYSKYERGLRSLPLEAAIRLAEVYGVSLDYLAGLTEEENY